MTLQNVVLWGRNLEEYRAMFALSSNNFHLKILGCGDGPSSFNKEATKQKAYIVSIDPIYRFTKEEISQRILKTSKTILEQVAQNRNSFIWKNLISVENLESIRMSAMKTSLKIMKMAKRKKVLIRRQ